MPLISSLSSILLYDFENWKFTTSISIKLKPSLTNAKKDPKDTLSRENQQRGNLDKDRTGVHPDRYRQA